MTGWEPPPRPPARRRLVGVALVACAVALAAALAAGGDPPERLAVDRATQAPQPRIADRLTPPGWPRPWPGLWRVLPSSPLRPRRGHALVATGRYLLVWGGADTDGRPLTDGAVFDLGTGRWRRLPGNGARDHRVAGVWTGRDVVLVSATETRRWDPSAATWRTVARVPRPGGLEPTGQVRAAGSTVVILLVAPGAGGPGTAAVFALDAAAAGWRRLPDPPVAVVRGDLLLADVDRLLLLVPARGERAAAAVELRLDDVADGWRPVTPPPGFAARAVGRLTGVLDRGRVLLWGAGPPAGGGGPDTWAAVREEGRWARIDAGPVRPGRVEALATGDGVIVWDRVDGRGALRRWGVDRWTRILPAPLPDGAPRPVAWTGSGVAVWGGRTGSGGVFVPR